ncbi:MAG: hypothetical protein N2645_21000 [Clostridia bacterium]|nr:hypothetical protein [Clostridia bacterium]
MLSREVMKECIEMIRTEFKGFEMDTVRETQWYNFLKNEFTDTEFYASVKRTLFTVSRFPTLADIIKSKEALIQEAKAKEREKPGEGYISNLLFKLFLYVERGNTESERAKEIMGMLDKYRVDYSDVLNGKVNFFYSSNEQKSKELKEYIDRVYSSIK